MGERSGGGFKGEGVVIADHRWRICAVTNGDGYIHSGEGMPDSVALLML